MSGERPKESGQPGATGPGARDRPWGAPEPAVKARNRKLLLILLVICVSMAAIGFAYVRWMMMQPPGAGK